jgi:hypothetical protein
MQSDPLQQLKGLHLPTEPSWWPPAIGWWVLAIIVVVLLAWMTTEIVKKFKARRPIREGVSLFRKLCDQLEEEQITEKEFLHDTNELLKRILIPGLGQAQYSRLSGQDWLSALDKISGTDHFTNGKGSILGDERFTKDPSINSENLITEIKHLLRQIQI